MIFFLALLSGLFVLAMALRQADWQWFVNANGAPLHPPLEGHMR
jgi:hypothetical protein